MLNSVDFPAAQRLYYDQLFKIADSDGDSYIGVNDSAFFKKSGLPNPVLGEVWQLADIRKEGRLDKEGFVIAMSLISLAQQGKRLGLEALRSSVPTPPKMQDIPPMKPDFDYVVPSQEKRQWSELFRATDDDGDGFITGVQARNLFASSGLALPVLSQIWGMADLSKDQKLDQQEFLLAMFLISVKRRGYELPASLPESLIASTRPDPSSPTQASLPPSQISAPPKGNEWVIPIAEKVKYDDLFKKTDTDLDGLISGEQARNLFLKSGVSLPELSRIWLLSDINQDQKLDRQEFAIAMFLIRCRIQGRDIPTPLPEALISSSRDDFVPTPSLPPPSKDIRNRYDNIELDLGGSGSGITSPAINPATNPTSPVPPSAGSLPNLSAEGSSNNLSLLSSLPAHLHTGGASSVPSMERFNSTSNLHATGSLNQGAPGTPFLSASIGSPAVAMSPIVSAPAVLQPPQFSTLSPQFGSVQIVPSTALEVERARQSVAHHERTKAELTNQLQETSNVVNESARMLEEEKAKADSLVVEIGELESQIGAQRARGASYKDNITAIRLEVKNMTNKKEQLEELLKEKQIQCEDQEQMLNDLRIELNEKTNEAERYQREVDQLKTRLETLRSATADVKVQLAGAKKLITDNKSEINRLTEETKGLKTATSSPPLTTRSASPLSYPNTPTILNLHPPGVTRTSSMYLPETSNSLVNSPALPHASSLTSSPSTTPFSFSTSSVDAFSFDNGQDDPFAYPSKDGFGLSSVTSDTFGAPPPPLQSSPSPSHPTQDTPVFNDANSFFGTNDAFGESRDPFTNSGGSGSGEIVAIADPFATSSSAFGFGSGSNASDSFSNANTGSVSKAFVPPTPHNTIVGDRKGGLSGTDIASAFSVAAFGGANGAETTTSFFGTNEETFGASAFSSTTSDSFGSTSDSFGTTNDAFGSSTNLRASGGFYEPSGGTTPFPSVDQGSFLKHGGATPFPSVSQDNFLPHGGTTPFPSVSQDSFLQHGGTTPFPSVDQETFHKHGGTTPFPSIDQAAFHKHGGATPFPSVDQENFHKHGGTTPFPSVDQEALKNLRLSEGEKRGSGGFQGIVLDADAFTKRKSGSQKAVAIDHDDPPFATESFGTNDAFGTADAFGSTNAFGSSEGFVSNTNDAFGSSDAFGGGNDAFNSGFGSDVFGKSDAFGSAPNAFGHDDGSLTSSGGGSVAEETKFSEDVFGKPAEGFGTFNFDTKRDGFDF